MSERITRAKAQKVVDFATEEELQRFWELDRIQKLGLIFGDPVSFNGALREARALARKILKRAANEA